MAISSNRMGLKKFAENLEKLKKTGSMGDYQSEEAKQARATVAPKKTVKKASPKRSDVGLDVGKKPAATVKKGQDVISDKMSFGKAFRAARNEGMKTFTWRGKKYGTKLKSEVKKKEETKPAAKPAPAPQQTPPKPEQGSSVKASKEQIANRLKRLTEQDRKVGGMITTARRYGRNKQAQRLQERYDLIRERQKKLMAQYKELTGKTFPDPRVNKG